MPLTLKRKRKKLRRKPRVLSIEQRREMLRGVTWGQFYYSREPDQEVLRIGNLRFKAGYGLFLGQPAIAILNGKDLIAVQYLKNPTEVIKNNYYPDPLVVVTRSSILGDAMDPAIRADPELEDKYVVGPKLKTNEELNDV